MSEPGPTVRKNGHTAFTIRVTHTLYREDMVDILAWLNIYDDVPTSRDRVMSVLRRNLPDYDPAWHKDIPLSEYHKAITRADSLISKLWPDWN